MKNKNKHKGKGIYKGDKGKREENIREILGNFQAKNGTPRTTKKQFLRHRQQTFFQKLADKWQHLSLCEQVFYLAIILAAMGVSIIVIKMIIDSYIETNVNSPGLKSNISPLSSKANVCTQLSKPDITSQFSKPDVCPQVPKADVNVQLPKRNKISPIMFFNDNNSTNERYNSSRVQEEIQKRSISVDVERSKLFANANTDLYYLARNIVKTEYAFDIFTNLSLTNGYLTFLCGVIKENLPTAIHPSVLRSVLTDQTFKIRLEPVATYYQLTGLTKEKINFNPSAAYDSQNNMMYFFPENTRESLSAILRLIPNECHHAGITATNKIFTRSPSLDPFLDENGQSNEVLQQELINAINNGQKQILVYQDLLYRAERNMNLSIEEENILNAFSDAAKNYIPRPEHLHRVSFSKYEEVKKRYPDGNIYIDIEFRGINRIDRMPVKRVEERENCINLYLNLSYFEKFKFEYIHRFLFDHATSMETYSRYDYGGIAGFCRPIAKIAAEILSTIEEYPDSIKTLLFPKVCDYLSKYHVVDNYCERYKPVFNKQV